MFAVIDIGCADLELVVTLSQQPIYIIESKSQPQKVSNQGGITTKFILQCISEKEIAFALYWEILYRNCELRRKGNAACFYCRFQVARSLWWV